MRTPPLDIPLYLIKEAQLYAPSRDALDAVCHVLADYPRLVAEARQMRSRLAQLDEESAFLDARLEALQDACLSILAL
ncbi:MAG: hypothetical protein ACREX4_15345 [Gammaproteobacteria bacterium]